MATYKPITDPSVPPSFGQSGESVKLLQANLNAQNQGKPGYVPLKVDGLYGPKTQAATSFKPNQLVVTAGPANMEFSKYSNDLQKALTGMSQTGMPTEKDTTVKTTEKSDPYSQMLDQLSQRSTASTKALISTIQAARANRGNEIDTQYDNYKRGLQLLGIQHNEAQSTPDLLMGHVQQAENEHRAKIQALDVEEQKALMDAENAQAKDDLDILKEKMNRVEEIKSEKANVLKEIADQIGYETKIAEGVAHQVYDVMNKLNAADKEIFLQEVSKKYQIPLGALTTALVDEQKARTKATKTSTGSGGVKGGTDGGYTYTGNDIQTYLTFLNSGGTGPDGSSFNARGDDGYVDPKAYIMIYQDWISNNGTNEGFLKKFPIKNVNPASYGLIPKALLPKGADADGGIF